MSFHNADTRIILEVPKGTHLDAIAQHAIEIVNSCANINTVNFTFNGVSISVVETMELEHIDLLYRAQTTVKLSRNIQQ